MAHFLFVDESGGQEAPFHVLAGITVEDRDLWNLVLALQEAEIRIFGRRYTSNDRELKAKKLLKTKTFRLAQLPLNVSEAEQQALAKKALDAGASAERQELAALAKAKLKYTQEALDICARFHCVRPLPVLFTKIRLLLIPAYCVRTTPIYLNASFIT